MASEYKKLGDYITEIDERNPMREELKLLGVSIEKKFMSSVANIIGTDLKNYKKIQKNEFACSLMQVSRDGGVAISLYKDEIASIMSPAYFIFKVTDTEKLLPEYLEIIVSNSEFDRQAVFYAIGGVRGTLTWEEFKELKINIPHIKEQKKIVRQFQTISNRIQILEKINKKLETELILLLEKGTLNINATQNLELFCDKIYSGGTPETSKSEYWNGDLRWLSSGETRNTFILDTDRKITLLGVKNSSTKLAPKDSIVIAIAGQGLTRGQVSFVINETYINQSVIVFQPKEKYLGYLFISLRNKYNELRNMSDLESIRGSLSLGTLQTFQLKIPSEDFLSKFNSVFNASIQIMKSNAKEIEKLNKLIEIVQEQVM